MNSSAAQVRVRVPRIAEYAVERARLTVVPRRRPRAARVPFVALVSIILLGGVVGLLLFNTSMQQASFASTALEEQADTLAARQQTLEMDLDRLRDPQRIATKAQHLGMVQAGNPAFLELGADRVVGEPSSGTAATPFRINPRPPAKPAAINPAPHVVVVPAPTQGTGTNSSDDTARGATAKPGSRAKMHQ